jgi:ABC-2 type transport system ATP-binding protein
MEEAENLCDQLAIMDKGKVIAGGSLADLRLQAGEKDVLRLQGVFNPLKVTEALRGLDEVEVVQADEQGVRLVLRDASRKLPLLFQALAQAGAEVRETKMTQPNLESLFIKLTGKELRE